MRRANLTILMMALGVLGWCHAASGQEAAAPAAPALEIEAYVSDIHDSADAAKGAKALEITAARNGVFSAKAVVRSNAPIEGLSAKVSDLKQGDATIPASAVQVRYGVNWGDMRNAPKGNDILLEKPLAVFKAEKGLTVVPVWVTVRVPKDAKPGDYTGELAIEAKGASGFKFPIRVKVAEWTVPDTQNWRTWVELIQSPETLSLDYGVPIWSDQHFALIGKSLRMIGESGSRVLYVPLIARTNQGNMESMVRWVKTGDNSYEYDLSAMEKYLDVALKEMGKPKFVVFYVWEVYLNPPSEEAATVKEGDSDYQKWEKQFTAAKYALKDKGPGVTVLDRKTGATSLEYLPKFTDPASKPLWTALFAAIRKKMADRGIEDAMMLGMLSDTWPKKEDAQFLNEVSGGLPWASCSHHAQWAPGAGSVEKAQIYGFAKVGYTAAALGYQYALNPEVSRGYGWKKEVLHAIYWRFGTFNTMTLNAIRTEAEANITGSQRGVGHIGGDMWFAVRDPKGRGMQSVVDRVPESYWHSLNIYGWMLGRGPEGPVATARYEVFREGVQGCEARFVMETALDNEASKAKLGEELAGKARKMLDERQKSIWRGRGAREEDFKTGLIAHYRDYFKLIDRNGPWKASEGQKVWLPGWQARDAELFAVAAEVEKKLK